MSSGSRYQPHSPRTKRIGPTNCVRNGRHTIWSLWAEPASRLLADARRTNSWMGRVVRQQSCLRRSRRHGTGAESPSNVVIAVERVLSYDECLHRQSPRDQPVDTDGSSMAGYEHIEIVSSRRLGVE